VLSTPATYIKGAFTVLTAGVVAQSSASKQEQYLVTFSIGLPYVRVFPGHVLFFGPCPGGFSENLAYVRVLYVGKQLQAVTENTTFQSVLVCLAH